nr:GreA/GreB family elongation factor [Myxococcota bacterium]
AALASARAAHAAAIEGATHAEARPENDKDTRGLEQSYLARGIAGRVAELEAAVATASAMALRTFGDDDAIALGALVDVEEAGRTRRFWLAAHGGGLVLPGEVTVLTPTSPIGRALLGKHVDDECEVGGALEAESAGPDDRQRHRLLTITAIA